MQNKTFEFYKNNSEEFFNICLPGFTLDKFDNKVLNLSFENDVHISNKRQQGSSTSIMLLAIHKLIFSENPVNIYILSPNNVMTNNLFTILENIIESLHNQSLMFKYTNIIKSLAKNDIIFRNNNNQIIKINNKNFINQAGGIYADAIIIIDEVSLFKYEILENIYEGEKYLRHRHNVTKLTTN